MNFSDEQLLRYNRQILLPQIDIVGQQQLQASTVVLIGMGGLGCAAAQYLAAAGLGHLLLCDGDVVELSNLQRQILFSEQQLGLTKVEAAQQRLKAINSELRISLHPEFAQADTLPALVEQASVVLDCSDNTASRVAISAACRAQGVPLVSASAMAWSGQQICFDFRREDSPCYACVYPAGEEQDAGCNEAGIMSPVVGLMGVNQALAAIRILSDLMAATDTELACFDGLQGQWHYFAVPRKQHCLQCGA